MTRLPLLSLVLALGLLSAAFFPSLARRNEVADLFGRIGRLERVDRARLRPVDPAAGPPAMRDDLDPAFMVRVEELGGILSSWQTVGGCGSSGATGSAGIKWIGRGATGGLFNVQVQANYSRLGSSPQLEQDLFLNTLVTRDVAQKWNVGVNIPFVYKYLSDPLMLAQPGISAGVDYSNGGLGDISLQGTRRFGSINDTAVTLVVGLPTGTYKAQFAPNQYLHQQQQLGFGKVTGALILDHTLDRIWGAITLGGVAAYRGGQNSPLDNYRSPSATGYAYAGYFWGPFVPALGLALTGFQKHDRDQTQDENSALFVAAANASLEWSTDWIAILAGFSLPYQYVGPTTGGGAPVPAWGWGSWIAALGVAVSPF
jgi:hypothetical protein